MSSLSLSEQWPWDKGWLRLYVLIPSLLAIVLTLVYFPSLHAWALFFLFGIAVGFVIRFIYARTGQRVNILMNCKSAQNGEVSESLLLIGQRWSAGVAILRDDVLILIPITGRRRKIRLQRVNAVKASHWLAGKLMWRKKILALDTTGSTRLAFALPESIAGRWCKAIDNKPLKHTAC